MANTYTQRYVHLVFAVKNRDALIKIAWKNELEMYITGIIKNHKHKLLCLTVRMPLANIQLNNVAIFGNIYYL